MGGEWQESHVNNWTCKNQPLPSSPRCRGQSNCPPLRQPSPLLYSLPSTLGLPVHSLCTAFYLPHLEGESHGLLGNYKVLSHAPSHLIFPSTGPGRGERKRDDGLSQVGLSRRRTGNEDLGDLLSTGSQGTPGMGRQGRTGTNRRKP